MKRSKQQNMATVMGYHSPDSVLLCETLASGHTLETLSLMLEK